MAQPSDDNSAIQHEDSTDLMGDGEHQGLALDGSRDAERTFHIERTYEEAARRQS
jgi:hypothetical protein